MIMAAVLGGANVQAYLAAGPGDTHALQQVGGLLLFW
jgi:hypothetical protein